MQKIFILNYKQKSKKQEQNRRPFRFHSCVFIDSTVYRKCIKSYY